VDIKCVVCGEPWHHELSGDMAYWEVRLFKAGAGCPSCCGKEPDPPWHPESFSDIENGDLDPMLRIIAYENRDKRPKWEIPPDSILWECKKCLVAVMRNQETGEKYVDRSRYSEEEEECILGFGPQQISGSVLCGLCSGKNK